ncbi:MAG: hypothetical protein U0974_11385 [Gemmatimonadales bacterium]|nr:hypothetical protein [Gemmatimonadales bacterium]MDZ4390316.1 hypothetical protein [Gemmatimonadales bacterium]
MKRSRLVSLCICCVVLFTTSGLGLTAQAPPARDLGPPLAMLAEEFTALTSVRELSDGRIFLSDPREKRIVLADLTTGEVRLVGREGSGPNEFIHALPITPLSGDSSLMANVYGRRWLLLYRDSIVATEPPDAPVMALRAFFGADSLGNVLTKSDVRAPTDSAVLQLMDRRTGRRTPVAKLASGDNVGTKPPTPFFRNYESARLARDGWIAVLRAEPYRVDWRSPDGRWTLGAPIPVPRVRMTAAQRQHLLRSYAPGLGPGEEDRFYKRFTLPDEVPPFQNATDQQFSSEGWLLVKRVPTVAEPGTRYDVIDRTGRVVRRIVLPLNQTILGFGMRSVYVVARDDNGIQRVQKHDWN